MLPTAAMARPVAAVLPGSARCAGLARVVAGLGVS